MYNFYTVLTLSLIALGFLAVLLLRYQTVLLGFTFILSFSITSASLSAFLFTAIFQLDRYWITNNHLNVFIYSALALIAFTAGVALAWRSLLKQKISDKVSELQPLWLNPDIIWMFVLLGAVGYVIQPYLHEIPSGQVVGDAYTLFLPFGVLFALVYGHTTGKYQLLLRCLAIYIPFILVEMIHSGHLGSGGIFVVQFFFVVCFWKGLNLRSLAIFCISLVLLMSLFFGWLESRYLIRNNRLTSDTTFSRVMEFGSEFHYVGPLSLKSEYIRSQLFDRIDMSSILAAQVRYQPNYAPFAGGTTITDNLLAVFVPRIFWPSKPVWVGGSELVTRYTGITFGKGTSVALPYQFELYANGGVVWVICGLFLIGWTVARLELTLFSSNLTLPQFMSLLVITKVLTTSEQTFTTVLMAAAGGAISCYFLGRLLLILPKIASRSNGLRAVNSSTKL